MSKTKKILFSFAAVLLLACLCVCLIKCTAGEPAPTEDTVDTTAAQKVTHTVSLANNGGTALENVGIYVYTDSTLQELVWFAKTDAEGKITFSDVVSDKYVIVLSGVPTGYGVESFYPLTGDVTQIVLSAGQMSEEIVETLTYKLGDIMMDFSVTTPDGTVYSLFELLQQKDAVVLNFWYTSCGPCKAEFPYLQEAYEEYKDQIEVLALNSFAGDDEAAVSTFQKENGLTFPMAKVGAEWERIMQLTAYPTTFVIDRFGNITMIHKGSIDDAQTFKDMFAYFVAEEYEQNLIRDITEIPTTAEEGSIENPTELGGVTSFEVTVDPGKEAYVDLYKVNDMYLKISSNDAYVLYNGKTYVPNNGIVSLLLSCPDNYTPAKVGIGNRGDKRQTFSVTLTPKGGTFSNPLTMKLGEFSVNVAAGNEQGVHYSYKAAEDGFLTLQCTSASVEEYGYYLYNLNSYAMRNLESEGQAAADGKVTLSIEARKGERVLFAISTEPDESNYYPSGKFKFMATFTAGELEEIVEIEKIAYAVTVTDENRNPVAGVNVRFAGTDSNASALTDVQGIAALMLPKDTYTATLVIPSGYTAKTSQFKLTEKIPMLAVKLDTVTDTSQGYTVRVIDSEGVAVSDVLVSVGNTYGRTNAEGYYNATLDKGSYTAIVGIPNGYTAESMVFPFPEDSSYQNIVLTKGDSAEQSGVPFTVNVVDGSGNAMTDVIVIYLQADAPVALAEVDENGSAVASLTPGDYTLNVFDSAGSGFVYDVSQAMLTAEKQSTTIMLSVAVGGIDYETAYWGNYYKVAAGSFVADMSSNVNFVEENNNWMYAFYPSVPGVYRFSVSEGAVVNYWGSLEFLSGPIYTSDTAEKYYELTVRSGEFDNGNLPVYVIGVSSVTGNTVAQVDIVRTGDVVGDLPTIVYEPTLQPTAFSLTETGTLTYVDLTGTAQLEKRADGYYLNGKKLYMNLGPTASPISMYTMLGINSNFGTGLKGKIFDENGEATAIEDYTQCMIDYVNCRDVNSGLYPMNDDLAYMFRMACDYMHWGDIESPNYIFLDKDGNVITGINPEIAWMFAVCYFA